MYYTKEHGSYYLYCDGELISMMDSVAVAFDKEDHVLLKHGSPDAVNNWANKARNKYSASGLDEIAENLVVVESDSWDIEELNKFLSTTGSIKLLSERLKV